MSTPPVRTARSDNGNVRIPLLGAHRLFFRAAGRAAPGLAARVGVVLFRMPPRHRTTDAEYRALASATRSELRAADRRIAVWRWGSGEPVLLIHGWGSRGGRLHSFVEPLVELGLSPVTFDAPGHGESQGRLSSLPEFIAAARTVADSLDRPPAGVVAHSIGGAAAVLALARGMTARRVVLLAPAAHPGSYASTFSRLFGIDAAVRGRMIANLERRFGYAWEEFDATRAAARLDAPVLVFHDREDADVAWSDGEAIARACPRGELVTTEGLGHRRIVHDPAVVARAVEFIARGAQAVAGEAPYLSASKRLL